MPQQSPETPSNTSGRRIRQICTFCIALVLAALLPACGYFFQERPAGQEVVLAAALKSLLLPTLFAILVAAAGASWLIARQDRETRLLAKSEQGYRLLFERNPLAAFALDASGSVITLNQAAEELTGFAKAELIGKHLGDVIPAFSGGHPIDVSWAPGADIDTREYGLRRANGKTLHVECISRRLTPQSIQMTLRDLTDDKREQQKMLQSHGELELELIKSDTTLREETAARLRADETLRAVVQAAPLAIITLDSDRNVQMWNPAAEALFGWPQSAVIGKPLPVAPPEERPGYEAMLAGIERFGAPMSLETRWQRSDGRLVDIGLSAAPLRCKQGQSESQGDRHVEGTVILVSDLSERKILQQQLQQVQKMEAIGKLAGGIAHDFNNLLTIINGFTDLALPQLPPQSPARAAMTEVRNAGDRAADLTRQLLAFSRKQLLQPRVLDLNVVIQDTNKMLRRLIGEDIDLQVKVSDQLGRVQADPCQIEQIIMNLAVNARDAMPRGGSLAIETRNVDLDASGSHNSFELPPGRYVAFSVRDTGCGMTKEVQQHIFEPFFTTKAPGKGTGLGLATVYGVVKQSGGHITMHSEVDVGTTFTIYLPRLDQESPEKAEDKASEPPPRGSETILLAEDETSVRKLTRTVLANYGYTVLEAKDGEEAIWLTSGDHRRIDLLITDVVMPGMSGRALASHLKEDRPDLKVLYLSGYTDTAMLRHGVLEDHVDFLHKPFRPQDLARVVREVLDKTAEVRRPAGNRIVRPDKQAQAAAS